MHKHMHAVSAKGKVAAGVMQILNTGHFHIKLKQAVKKSGFRWQIEPKHEDLQC